MADALYKRLWIRTKVHREIVILDNVYTLARGSRIVRTGTYRDTGWKPGTALIYASGTTGTENNATALPVVGVEASTPDPNDWSKLRFATPDDAAHVRPRFYFSQESGVLFGLKADQPIPPPAAVPTANIPFTVNATTNICTAGSAHGVTHLSTVAVSAATTLAAPLAAGTVYTFLWVSATDFMLMTSAGAVVDFTNTGTGQQTAILVTSNAPPADDTASFQFFPDAWKPVWSTTDPRV